ncbi:MAG: ferredoxin [Rhodospirillales bacterium]
MSNQSTEADSEPFFRCHVFCCTNVRPAGHPKGSCARRGSERLRNYMKVRAKELGLEKVRINAAGCLDRCEHGPTMVVYPEGVWYRYETFEDIDEILLAHVGGGRRVDRLLLPPSSDGGV